MVAIASVLLFSLAAVSALPADFVLSKPPGPRYQHVSGGGRLHLVDTWKKASDVAVSARFDPDRQIVYHLFTRENPSVSQPLLHGNEGLLGLTNYDQRRRTIVLLHGWLDSVTSVLASVLVPAFLSAEDVNVIVVDWSAGANTINYVAACENTITAGKSVAGFINWMNDATGVGATSYHIVGHDLGAHMAGVVGRNVYGDVAYITALEPVMLGFITNDNKFRDTDGAYTEVIHTNAGALGYLGPLGDVDFYPNGGANMPGCGSQECSHERSIHYFQESITNGGFRGRRCGTYIGAMTGNCILLGVLRMGGIVPKTGSTGIYYMETNAAPPFSQA